MDSHGIFVGVITLLLAKVLQGFPVSVHDDPHPCPAKDPCICDISKVECSNLTQTEFPTFTMVNATWRCWTLIMNYNYNIKRIPAGAFHNLPLCSLQIGHNGFEVIEDGALNGSEPYLDSVFMQFNNFRELPNEIARMPNLTMLSIHDNPIKTLPQKMAFAPNLQLLDIGSPEMTIWPASIRTLKSVWSLTLYKLPMSDLPLDAFDGLEGVILYVSFSSTNLKVIPRALRRLRNMTDLSITDSIALASEGITDDAFKGMESLRNIYISNSSIKSVPNVFTVPFLTHLSLTDSPLSSWDVTTLPEQSLLQSVEFRNTDIDHIPAAVRRIRSLTSLNLDNTKVTTIGSDDLVGLQKLSFISLNQTPLTDISIDAFNDTYSLQGLGLDSTKLPGIPRAIERLPALRVVSLLNITIECSCTDLGWMKDWIGWQQQYLYFSGNCHNIHKYLTDYIREDVPKCH